MLELSGLKERAEIRVFDKVNTSAEVLRGSFYIAKKDTVVAYFYAYRDGVNTQVRPDLQGNEEEIIKACKYLIVSRVNDDIEAIGLSERPEKADIKKEWNSLIISNLPGLLEDEVLINLR